MKLKFFKSRHGIFGQVVLTAALAAICGLIAVDVGFDLHNNEWTPEHVILEFSILLSAITAFIFATYQLAKKDHQLSQVEYQMAKLTRQQETTRRRLAELSSSFVAMVDSDFKRWGLTESEKEIGYLLLKGLSVTEVATIRSTSPSTVRKQSMAIYRKSGLSSRNELASYFMEDLLCQATLREY